MPTANPYHIIPGNMHDLTVAQLREEIAYWDWEIVNATAWGAALAAANGFRKLAQHELARRNVEP
jgi:hypothetical protein